MNDLLFQLFHIFIVYFFTDHLIQSCIHGFRLFHCLNCMIIRYIVDFRNNLFVLGRSHLCTVFPITFIAVIFRRIMACRDNDAGDTSEFPQCERKFRRGSQRLEYIRLNAVSRQTKRRFIRKLR